MAIHSGSAQYLEPPLLRGAVEFGVSAPTKKSFPGLKGVTETHPSSDVARMPATDSDTVTPCNMNLLSIPSALITPVSCIKQSKSMEDLHKLGEGEKVVTQLVHVMKNIA